MIKDSSLIEGGQTAGSAAKTTAHPHRPKYPGIRVTCNGNQLVTQHVETRITEGDYAEHGRR
jgi:hypothetical protein